MKNKEQKTRHRSGIVLILALLLMAAITASSIGISVVITTTSNQSRNLDNFIIASLSADSGLERGLAVVKEGRKSLDLASTVNAANIPTGSPIALGNSNFSVAAIDSAAPINVPLLASNQSFTFDILATGAGDPPNVLQVTGGDTGAGTTGTAVLDVSWVLIDANGNTNFSGRHFLSYTNFQTPLSINLNEVRSETSSEPVLTGSTNHLGYRISIRAVGGTVANVQVLAPTALPSSVAITSTGRAGLTQSIKTASVLWQLPSSKLFNFVLFTEGPIISCGSLETSC